MFSKIVQNRTEKSSKVQTDPTQISKILEESFKKLNDEQLLSVTEASVTDHYKPFIDQCNVLLYGQTNYMQAIEEMKQNSGSQKGGVCAKTLRSGDVAWKCEDCELDPTCIICQECFEKGNHKGHRVWLKKNVGGCCDCGDPDAWRENGFCSDHKGYEASSEQLLQNLPNYVKSSSKEVFRSICRIIKIQYLEIQGCKKSELIDQEGSAKITKLQCLLKLFYEFLVFSVDQSLAFIHFIAEAMTDSYFETINFNKDSHQCCYRAFISNEEKESFLARISKKNEELKNLSEDFEETREQQYIGINEDQILLQQYEQMLEKRQICSCTVLDLSFQCNHLLAKKSMKLIYEFYFQLFQSYKFKQHLGLSFAANFKKLILKRTEQSQYNMGSIGVQILTIDEIGLMIMKEEKLRENLVKTYELVIDKLVSSSFQNKYVNYMYSILFDIKYLSRPKTLHYAVYETDFLEKILEQLGKLYFTDIIEYRTNHIQFDATIYKEGLYNIDLQLIKTYKNYIKEIDPKNVERNRKLMSAFISFFEDINNRLGDVGENGFFAIPLHRLFSYYLSRLIMYNYLIEKDINPQKQARDIMLSIVQKFIVVPNNQNRQSYIQHAIMAIIRPLSRQWSFNHEVLSGKFVMCGLFINHLPKLLYSIYEQYLMLIMGLFQTLIVISPKPQMIINMIIQAFEINPWLKTLHFQVLHQNLNKQEFEKFKPIVDDKKLRQLLSWELKLFIQLSVVEMPFLYPLNTDICSKDKLFYQEDKITKKIENLLRSDIKRQIIHAFLQFGGKVEIKTLKKSLPDFYTEHELFDNTLLEVADQQREGPQKSLFKLKEQYYQQLEPYYQLQHEPQQKLLESIKSIQNVQFNEILGDFNEEYKFGTEFNHIVQEAIGQSVLITYVRDIIIIWAQNQEEFKVIDNQAGHECLKILMMVIQSALKSQIKQQTDFILNMIQFQDNKVIKSLEIIRKQDLAMDKAIQEILVSIFNLNKNLFRELGQQLGLVLPDESDYTVSTNQTTNKSAENDVTIRDRQIKQKEEARLKKEKIMMKFQSKRQKYINKNDIQSTSMSLETSVLNTSRTNSSQMDQSLHEDDEIECALCKETLLSDNFYSDPYGQFAYISKSKLMAHTLRQTLGLQNELVKQQKNQFQMQQEKEISSLQEEEEEKKDYEMIQQSIVKDQDSGENLRDLDLSYLNETELTGGTMIKCSHYSHFKCLNSYLTAKEADVRKRELSKMIGLDHKTFQCPLCRHLSNGLIPFETLDNYNENKYTQRDFDQYLLLSQIVGYLSRIIQQQQIQKSELLPIDIKKQPLVVLRGIESFILHRIQLIDIKGTQEFLKRSRHHVGIREYSNIIDIAGNVVKLILDGEIKVSSALNPDEEMTEEGFEDICIEQFRSLIDNHCLQQGQQQNLIFETDASILCNKLIFYLTLLLKGKYVILMKLIHVIIKNVYKVVQIQALFRLLFLRSQGQLKGSSQQIYDLMNLSELVKLAQNEENSDFIIRSQLPFLRKTLAMILLIHSIYRQSNPDLMREDDKFIMKLLVIRDDSEELQLLQEYLCLENSYQFILDKPQVLEIQNNSVEISAFMEIEHNDGKSELERMVEQLATKLSSIDNLRRQIDQYIVFKELDSQQLVALTKEQILESPYEKSVEMPNQLKLLDTYYTFKFFKTPTDLQGVIQEYYKKVCKNCNTQPKDMSVCLLCGEIACFTLKCCQNLPGMRNKEGELTFHTRTCEGGVSLFLQCSDGKLVLIEGDRSCQKSSPYINKFGESYSLQSKRWDNFFMDETTGGSVILEEYKKLYMNFKIGNEIMKERSQSDYVWRLRVI
ncbi:zinc finger family protein [Stylonychia lemnae]|uniref:E3 ubiquitin-protein ligase n=1 Tax=Stylonychia lemnae TaxID=5949 RepID=A0A077ZXP6_STYLE|nr:zinc finger family protein [Stylonychia lemnae]|eukprot:CDW74007.1 zinc finger family protein [Stylonychia lemnae]